MMQPSLSPAPQKIEPTHAPRVWTLARLVGFIGVTLFIATEILALLGSAIWAVAGLANLDPVGTGIVAAALGIPSLLAILKCAQLAFLAETDPAND